MTVDPAILLDRGPVDDHGQPLPSAVAGVVSRTPGNTTDELQVTIAAFDDGARSWSFSCPWQPRFTSAGTYVAPSAGDRCLVQFDDEQAPWVPIYWPS